MHTIANGRRSLVAGALGRRYACWVLRFAAAAVFLVAASLEIAHADQRAEKPQGQGADYVDAIMGHVRLRIPRDHLFFGVTRPGENWLDPKSKSTAKDPREINSFDLLLWPDLRPIRAGVDRALWERAQTKVQSAGSTSEVVVVVEKASGQMTSRARLERTTEEALAERPREKTEDASIGLMKWRVVSSEYDIRWDTDIYHDPELTTFIECRYPAPHAPNPFQACRQYVVLGDLNLWVVARYRADLLSRWKEIAGKLDSMVRAFKVSAN